MARRPVIALVATVLLFAGCGGDEEGGGEPVGGTTGESGSEAPANDITAGEFLAKLGPEKEIALEGIVATSSSCDGVKVESSLLLLVSDAASKADPEAPLTPIVEAEC